MSRASVGARHSPKSGVTENKTGTRQLSSRGNLDAANASPLRRDAPALALFLALTALFTNPLLFYLTRAVEDTQDALLNTWIMSWVGHALITDPLHLFDANIFYPYSNSLAFSEILLPQGLFALPFTLAFANPILSYNLVLLFSFLLAAYVMYLFVLDLTRARGAAMLAGIIFAFNPYNLGNLAQIQLLSFGWLPLALFFLRRFLATHPPTNNLRFTIYDFRFILLFALFFSLQCLSSFYYAFLAGLCVGLYLLFWIFKFAVRKKQITQFPTHPLTHSPTLPLTQFFSLLVAFVLIFIFVVPFFLPYLNVQRELGFERKISESEPFSASLKLYAEVSPRNIVYGNLLAPRPQIFSGGYPQDNLFPGLIALVLALVGITFATHRAKWFYFLLLSFAFLLSLGPRFYLTPTQPTDIPLPYRWLYDALPLMRALRAPVRFDALVMFALAILSGLGFAQLILRALRFSPSAFRLLPSTFILLVSLEYLNFPAAQITFVPTENAIPQSTRWLAQQPHTIILELPMLASDPIKPLDLTAQYFSIYHWHSTPDGYSGFIPGARGEIAYEMQSFPSARAISLLQALDVQYVVIHANQIADWTARRDVIQKTADLQFAQQFGDDFIYRVAPRAMDARALSAQIYFPNPVAPNRVFTADLIVQNSSARAFAIKPTDQLQIVAEFSDGSHAQTSASLPLVTSTASVIPFRLDAPTRAGDYQVAVRVQGAEIAWNVSGELKVRNEEPARQVVLPARVALSAPLKAEYARGETIAVDLTWMPMNKINAYYSASVRVVDARGNKIVAQDREPSVSTFLWTPGVSIPDNFSLALPRDLAAGNYSVQLLMYQAEQNLDALLLDENFAPRESVVLGSFKIK